MQISYPDTAAEVMSCVGGAGNIVSNALCMTRLRLAVANPSLIDEGRLNAIPGVLGTARRGPKGIEVVFGPNRIRPVYSAFLNLSGVAETEDIAPSASPEAPAPLKVRISPRKIDDIPAEPAPTSELDDLTLLLSSVEAIPHAEPAAPVEHPAEGARLLVINGPNINMLGIREPGLYGKEDFNALLELCHKAAEEQGFIECRCFQSNHEGDLVDVIQDAYGAFDGIVINPGAYTHTSIAILDALKSVSIPTIEVHISKVNEREDFRQVSYVRLACFETIMGEGIQGYAHAIRDMAEHLDI